MPKKYSEEVQKLLKEVVGHFDQEDRAIRERQIRTARRLKLFWEGFHQVWYSEVAHDWRIWDEADSEDTDQAYYDKPVNVFRAYLESIIAALSVTVPPVKCFPDDADNTLDLSTAKAGDKIAQLIYRHNDVPLLWIHGLFIYCTEGMVACYSYPKSDEEYGTYQKKTHEDVEEQHEYVTCSLCGYNIEDKTLDGTESPLSTPQNPMQSGMNSEQGIVDEQLMSQEQDEFMPDDDDVLLHAAMNSGQELCPACMKMMDPEVSRDNVIITRLVGVTNEPKTRMCMEVYGLLNVKIANYAKKQCDTPYLNFCYETHYANAIERFENVDGDKLRKKLKENLKGGSGVQDPYEAWGRLSPQYQGEYPINNVTIRNCWLRPAAFNVLKDEEVKILKEKFPDGAKVVLVNDEFAEAENENLDDCWTLTHNPLSDYIHHDPLGLLLVSIQEITNDIISLTTQTIEHGIPQTFADPTVLNFKAYEQTEVTPGGIFPATPKSGKGLNDGFHEVKTATLSGEVLPFAQNIQQLGQLVSGALPSLFGGQLEGSETASQYSMSRAQALQRLQNTWKMLTIWWKTIFGKVIPMYIKETKDDDRDVQQNADGNFINILIKRAELEGKIGRVELEANENLPLTWSQQKDVVMQLLQGGNPEILAMIGSPENLPLLREAIGLTDFYVPGEDDRDAEYDEIKLLLNSEPIQMPPDPMMAEMAAMDGQELPPQEVPSIEIDPDIDNHEIRFEIDRKFLVSEAGRQAKIDNEAGYRNVLLHAKMHLQMLQMQQMQQATQEESAANPKKPNGSNKRAAPVTGEQDVQTTQ